jgi:hypothetical protein
MFLSLLYSHLTDKMNVPLKVYDLFNNHVSKFLQNGPRKFSGDQIFGHLEVSLVSSDDDVHALSQNGVGPKLFDVTEENWW